METISLKLSEDLHNDLKEVMKTHKYATKTEFLREAIRDKIYEMKIRNSLGKGKHHKTTNQHLEEVREKVGKEILKELN